MAKMKFFDNKKENNAHQPETPVPAPVPQPPPAPAPRPVEQKVTAAPAPAPAPQATQRRGSNTVIGTSINIRGDITAEETVTIEGSVDGTIETTQNVVIAPEGRVRADIRASVITISGRVKGDMFATNKVDLTPSGQLEGNIQAPKLAIAESAMFKGSIDMSQPAPSNQPGKGERRLQPEGELVKN
jgi:cytoskeletal protein CcmA (bactofilin family)